MIKSFAGSGFAQEKSFIVSSNIPIPEFQETTNLPNCFYPIQEPSLKLKTEVEDPKSIARITLNYRPISDTAWKTKSYFNQDSSYLFEIEDSYFIDSSKSLIKDITGLIFYFEAINSDSIAVLSDTNRIYICYDSPGLPLPPLPKRNISLTGKDKEYHLISFPIELDNKNIESIFESKLGSPSRFNWRMFHSHNPGNTPAELELWEYKKNNPDFTTVERGKSYWILTKKPDSIFTGSGSTTLPNDEPFVIRLQPGWNQIGNPYNFNVWWPDVEETNRITPGGLQFMTFEDDFNSNDDGALLQFSGGFVCADSAFDLIIPTYKNPIAQSLRRSKRYFYDQSEFKNQTNWFLQLSLSIDNDSLDLAGIGMHSEAKEIKDKFDRITPPPFP